MEQGREKYYKRERGRDLRRSKPGEPRKRFEVSEEWARHKEIARRHALGQKNTVIARALGVSPQMVSYTVNSAKVQDHVDVINGERDAQTMVLKDEIRALLPRAVKNLEEILMKGTVNGKDASATLIARESNNIIDREAGKPTQKVEGQFAHAILTADDIEDIKARAMKSSDVIEAEALPA